MPVWLFLCCYEVTLLSSTLGGIAMPWGLCKQGGMQSYYMCWFDRVTAACSHSPSPSMFSSLPLPKGKTSCRLKLNPLLLGLSPSNPEVCTLLPKADYYSHFFPLPHKPVETATVTWRLFALVGSCQRALLNEGFPPEVHSFGSGVILAEKNRIIPLAIQSTSLSFCFLCMAWYELKATP